MTVRLTDEILQSVEKPSRYIGNEWNSVHKNTGEIKVRFAFCFPDIYEIGMSHLGMKILYHLLNERPDTWCERVFAPWVDMERIMRSENIPLFALESHDPVKDFDMLGFTLQYEMSYTNIVNMLDLAGIPIRASQRGENHPFVCAGGPCAYNPEPLAEVIDFFLIGEGEDAINEIIDTYISWKGKKLPRKNFLEMVAAIEGVYVPSFYDINYNSDGTIKEIIPKSDRYPAKIRKRIIINLDDVYYPEKPIVPFTGIVHDRIMLEVFRGCIRGCRFCQAGYVYRPVREKSSGKLTETAKKLVESTGYDEISLTSLSTSDYTSLEELTQNLIDDMEPKKVSLSLPSLRIDSFSLNLMEKAQKVRKGGLTFAPEAGTQRLRDVINKGVTEEDLMNSVSTAFLGGWGSVKLYFMLGLPTETAEDIEGIGDLAEKVVKIYRETPKEKRGKKLEVTVSTSYFVPKPFTPFQWEAQDTMEVLREKQKILKNKIKNRAIIFTWNDPELSFLEAVYARGDRRTGEVLIKAWEKGCKFDSWDENFKFNKWMEAFNECGIDPTFYANRKREYDEIFPWEHIDIGVTKQHLIRENKKAYQGKLTENCRVNCSGCGAAIFGGGICIE
ncbi:MAG TPA: TIGR03960 family B12-binding radical SAM protein [Clostridiaceae bacterium]|nr:TIGR03960 family B12-binding radical SAM protein [Clostridiaceae bacterium]